MNRIICSALLLSTLALPSYAQTIPETKQQISLSFAPVVKQVAPAVINIFTKRMVTQRVSPFMNDPFFSQFFGNMGFPQQRLEGSLGSGLIVDADGLAITNAHVIKGAEEITVGLSNGREYPAKIVLEDEASDLALLRIDSKGVKLPTAHLQSSENLEVGDLVIAIGNPFGVGQTVTSGIISAQARSSLNINDYNFFIQTDAAINPGNSGGPLVSMSGGVIGINSAIYSKDGGSLGIGFAIPSEMVQTILAAEKSGQITKKGTIIHPWLGLKTQDITSDIATSLSLSSPKGVLVSNIHEASPALSAGLKQGDVIISVNDHPVLDSSEFRYRMATIAQGESARIGYLRKGEMAETELKATNPPEIPPRHERVIKGSNPFQGATVANLNPALEMEMGLKNVPSKGVVVTAVTAGTLSERVLNLGDIIVAINGVTVTSSDDVQKLADKRTRQGWVLRIITNGQERTMMVR